VSNMNLSEFLIESKRETYASSGESGEKIVSDGSKEFVHERVPFKYRDRYFGSNPFAGEEVVWQNGNIVWIMNYYGKVISKTVSVQQVYEFLKKCLMKVEPDKPFRGPERFEEKGFSYVNEVNGDMNSFNGTEKISYDGKVVYVLFYHGGLVKNTN